VIAYPWTPPLNTNVSEITFNIIRPRADSKKITNGRVLVVRWGLYWYSNATVKIRMVKTGTEVR